MATSMSVSRTVAAPPAAVWEVLTDPAAHVAIDGSDMVRGSVEGERLTAEGQLFTMEMFQPHLGDYRTGNLVTAYEEGRRIGWATGRDGHPPSGQRWEWQIEADGDGSRVTHVYDWSRITDPATLARVRPPKVSEDQLRGSLDRLAALVEP